MNVQELTYLERLKVSWLLIWRGALIGSIVGLIFGAIAGFIEGRLEMSDDWGRAIIALGSFLVSIILVGPLLVKMMMSKRFDGFRLQAARVSQ